MSIYVASYDESGNLVNIGTKGITNNVLRLEPTQLELAQRTNNKLELMKLLAIRAANRRMDEYVLELNKEYAAFEPGTWEIQRTEWIAYNKDPATASTPYLDQLAAIRGLARAEIMSRVGVKVMGYAQLQGILHSYIDGIEAATDEDGLVAATAAPVI